MTQFLYPFLKCFFSEYSLISASENGEVFTCRLSAAKFAPPNLADVQKAFTFVRTRDQFSFAVAFGNSGPISFFSKTTGLQDFLPQLISEHKYQETDPISVTIEITKTKETNRITIYDLETFISTLKELSIAQTFGLFDKVLRNSSSVEFEVLGLDAPFRTGTLSFQPFGSVNTMSSSADRIKLLETLGSVCYFTNIEEYKLVPEDFKIVTQSSKHKEFCSQLDKYAALLSVVFLFDITSLYKNDLQFRLNGYKSIKGEIDLGSNSLLGVDEYFSIYQWVYAGGNLSDKIGLARNIISLHFEKQGELALKGNVFQSIQSSHKVYEKQNIRQYIEIRNKISDQLLDFNNRASRIIETFASGFQKSALAIISFYFSAIALKVLAKGDVANVFTLDVTVLSLAFLAGSVVYFMVLRWEVKKQRERFVNSYTNLKERYTDLLDKSDIERILNNDKEFNADLQFIDSKFKNYSRMWWVVISILLLTTCFLYVAYNLDTLHLMTIPDCNIAAVANDIESQNVAPNGFSTNQYE